MAAPVAVDLWLIQPWERAHYEERFRALQPINGIVTGDQAKGFFLQSQLPPAVLGQIWGLADTDADGKMNISEFSIACKLINLKLRGFEIPEVLPPSLVQQTSPSGVGSVPPAPIPAVERVASLDSPEMERQRQLEWEKQRCQELQQQRQREQETVLMLREKNRNLSIELSQLNNILQP